jgi:hypothetical protein
MPFSLPQTIEILERTPAVLEQLLPGLSPAWTDANEGPDTFSPFDVVGHLVHGEKTDWMVHTLARACSGASGRRACAHKHL